MAISEEQISKVLSDIQAGIPRLLLKNAFTEVKVTPTVEFVVRKALESDKISQEKKDKLKVLLDSGEFTKTKMVENPKILKMIDNYVGRQINKAIKEGRLPQRSEIKNLPSIKHFYEKVQNNKDKGNN